MRRLLSDQINMPSNYFELSEEERLDICVGVMETIYEEIIKASGVQFDKIELFHRVLDATIEYNEKTENYEVCGLLADTKKLLDATTNNKLYK